MIKVLVVDDHPLMRKGLKDLFADHVDVSVQTANSGSEAIHLARTGPGWDVVLMDVHMPGDDGVETTRKLLEVTRTNVVILTSDDAQDVILAAVEAGAIGYLLKDAEPEELIRGVLAAAASHSPFDPRAAGVLLGGRRTQQVVSSVTLTQREEEVLALVAEGLMNKQIGRKLGITERTVKAHLTGAFQRIGAADRTQAALWWERNRA